MTTGSTKPPKEKPKTKEEKAAAAEEELKKRQEMDSKLRAHLVKFLQKIKEVGIYDEKLVDQYILKVDPQEDEENKASPQMDLQLRMLLTEHLRGIKGDYDEKLVDAYIYKINPPTRTQTRNAYPQFLVWLYVLGLGIFWILSYFFPETLSSTNIPLWGDWNIVLRWFLGFYWAVFIVLGFSDLGESFGGLGKASKTTLWIAVVVLVIVPGAIVYGMLPATTQILVAQLFLVVIFTALPASLFPLFIRSKGKALREEFFSNLNILEPNGGTERFDIFNKKFDSLYGKSTGDGSGLTILAEQASFPVYLNTLIIGIGWLLFFITTELPEEISAHNINGVVTPFTYGFLGAYLFSLGTLFRRYLQSDLKTTAYAHSSYRILWTWVLAFVLTSLPLTVFQLDVQYQNQVISIVAFLAGIFPDIAFQVIGQVLKPILGIVIQSFRQTHPLSEISGITVWIEARLLEENIENIQNLVTIDIPDLMLRTNLHPSRILDWIDQGILLLHMPIKKLSTEEKKAGKQTLETYIRDRGIVTATDLANSYRNFKKEHTNEFFISKEYDPIVESMVVAFSDDPNMYHILAWRDFYEENKKSLASAGNLMKA